MTTRVVLDTNVYISALRYGGKPKRALDYALDGKFALLISTPLKLELERVLRDKFSYSQHEIATTTAFLWRDAEWVAPGIPISLCPDEPDNRVLECAIEGKASYIVTGDRHLLNLPPVAGLAILTPDTFLSRFSAPSASA